MELNKELLNKIKLEYYQWRDDCELHKLPTTGKADEVFSFIAYYIDKEK